MNAPASDVYAIVLEETSSGRRWFRSLFVLFTGLFSKGDESSDPGGMIISVVHKQTGDELFRHVEDMGDDEGHLLHDIEHDLATMTADEFGATWG